MMSAVTCSQPLPYAFFLLGMSCHVLLLLETCQPGACSFIPWDIKVSKQALCWPIRGLSPRPSGLPTQTRIDVLLLRQHL